MMGMGVEYVGDAGDLSISCESSLPLDALCTGTSQQIRILHKTNKKYVNLLYMYSILGRGSFCFNYSFNSAWHGADQFVALLRWYGSPGFFDSGL